MRTTLTLILVLAFGLVSTVAAGAQAGAYVPTFPRNDYAAWSPDGKRIAFTSDRLGSLDLFVMNGDGTHQRPVLRSPDDEWWPTWSPDARRIAFVSDVSGEPQIYSVEVATGHVTRLTFSDAADYTPDWSSDGRIAFRRRAEDPETEKATSQVYVMNGDGSGLRRLVVDDEYDVLPAWSPDSSRIAFVGGGDDDAFIDVVNADGSGRLRLTSAGAEFAPNWSPDGKQIVFTSYDDEEEDEDIWIMGADGSGQRPLYGTVSASELGPRFAPMSNRILFESDKTGEWQVYTMSVAGTNARRLTGLARVMSSTGRRCTVIGTAGRDVLLGTARDDVICGLGGNDVLRGGGGDDLIDGGAGNDTLTGSSGDDTMLGGLGSDTFNAVDGFRDSIDGGPGPDRARIDPNDWISSIETLF